MEIVVIEGPVLDCSTLLPRCSYGQPNIRYTDYLYRKHL
jgi:hypothetical protein